MNAIGSSRREDETAREKRAWRWLRIALALASGFVVAAGINVYSVRSQPGMFTASVETRAPLSRDATAYRFEEERFDEEDAVSQPLAAEPLIEPELDVAVRTEERSRWPSPAVLLELDAEHWPPEPAVQQIIADTTAFMHRLETLLASDPDTLEEVRALLDERDPALLAENVRLLQETFAIE